MKRTKETKEVEVDVYTVEHRDTLRFGVWEMKAYKGNIRDELIITHVNSGGTIMVPSTCNGWVKLGNDKMLYGGEYHG